MTIEWNYRVFLEDNGDYIIREVFYETDGGAIALWDSAWYKSDRPFCGLRKRAISTNSKICLTFKK